MGCIWNAMSCVDCFGNCCGRNGRCCLKKERKPFEYPNWVYITPNPCRVIEAATFLGLIAMFVTVIVYASFTLDNLDEIQRDVAEAWYEKVGDAQDQIKPSDYDYKTHIDYLKTPSFANLIGLNIGFTIVACGFTIFIASKFLNRIITTFIIMAIVGLTAAGYVCAYLFLDNWIPSCRWGAPTILFFILLIGYLCIRKTIRYAVACLDSGLDFFWESCICSALWVFMFLLLHVTWALTCISAYMYFKYRNIGKPANKNDILLHYLEFGVKDNYATICVVLLFCYFWGKTYIEYFSDVIYCGAIARKILHGKRGTFLESIKIAITKLNGTLSFASFYIAIIKTLKYCFEPKEIDEPSMFHAIPFYFFIADKYKTFGGKYLKWFFICLEKVCDYINSYALIVAAIYGDTLCGSGIRLFELGIIKSLQNDIAIEFIVFLLVFFNACLTSMLALGACKYGVPSLNILPAPNDNLLFVVVAITFIFSYIFSKVVFEPVIALSRTTFVLYELEPALFLENDPEHFEAFGSLVTSNLKDLDGHEQAARQEHLKIMAAAKRSEINALQDNEDYEEYEEDEETYSI